MNMIIFILFVLLLLFSVPIMRQTLEGAWRAVSTMVGREPRSRCMALQSGCCEQSWPPLFLPQWNGVEDLQYIFGMKDSPYWLFVQFNFYSIVYIRFFVCLMSGCRWWGMWLIVMSAGVSFSVLRTSMRDKHARVQNNFPCTLGFWRLAIEDLSDRHETAL